LFDIPLVEVSGRLTFGPRPRSAAEAVDGEIVELR